MLSECGKSLARVLGGRIEAERQMNLNAVLRSLRIVGRWSTREGTMLRLYLANFKSLKYYNAHLRATNPGVLTSLMYII